MRGPLFAALLFALSASFASAALKVAVLHPLLADLAREVGGDRVEVVDLLGLQGDPHKFEPSPADLSRAANAKLFLASGMGMESYLPALRDILAGKATVLEVGATLPTLEGACDHPDHEHDDHHHGIDPHWWHSPEAFRRAASVVAEAFAAADPPNEDFYLSRAEDYRDRLTDLERWMRRELARIPPEQRYLATSHDAFGYFCKAFDFTAIPLQGLNREQSVSPARLAETIATIREKKVRAIFPEAESNPKTLRTLVSDTGVKLAQPLIADGSAATSYEEMMRTNVQRIVAALKN